MKRWKYAILLVLLCLFLLALVACGGSKEPEGTNSTTETESAFETESGDVDEHVEHIYDNGRCSVCNELLPYDLEYELYYDGTCRVSKIVTNPLYTEPFTVTIPSTAPNGARVVAVSNPALENYPIPAILTASDYAEIEERIQAHPQMGGQSENYYSWLRTYYTHLSRSKLSHEAEESLVAQYPFLKLTDIYVLNLNPLSMEIGAPTPFENKQALAGRLATLGYTVQDLMEDEANLCNLIAQSDLENKETIIQNLPLVSNCLGGGIREIVIEEGIERISDYAFSDLVELRSVKLPDTMQRIYSGAFFQCIKLEEISIPKGVTHVSSEVFSGCQSLKHITLPNSAIFLGDGVFKDCVSLQSVTLPNGAAISKEMFKNCSSLASISVPEGARHIYESAFEGCSSLSTVLLPSSLISIGRVAFKDCVSLTELCIPKGVTTLGDWAFAYCRGLESVVLPDQIKQIGNHVFSGCTSLTTIDIPDTVTSIGEWAFYDCESLTSMSLPANVATVGEYAFFRCDHLQSFTFEGSVALWEHISKGDGWSSKLAAREVVCSNGTVELS